MHSLFSSQNQQIAQWVLFIGSAIVLGLSGYWKTRGTRYQEIIEENTKLRQDVAYWKGEANRLTRTNEWLAEQKSGTGAEK